MNNPVNDNTWQVAYEKEGDWADEGEKWKYRMMRGNSIEWFDRKKIRYGWTEWRRWSAIDHGDGYEGPFYGSELTGFRVVRNKQ